MIFLLRRFTRLKIYHHIYFIAHMPTHRHSNPNSMLDVLLHEASLMAKLPWVSWSSVIGGWTTAGRTWIFFFQIRLSLSEKIPLWRSKYYLNCWMQLEGQDITTFTWFKKKQQQQQQQQNKRLRNVQREILEFISFFLVCSTGFGTSFVPRAPGRSWIPSGCQK